MSTGEGKHFWVNLKERTRRGGWRPEAGGSDPDTRPLTAVNKKNGIWREEYPGRGGKPLVKKR